MSVNPLELLLGLCLLAWSLHALKAGWITSGNGPRLHRSSRLILYWLLVAIIASMSALVLTDTLVYDL